MGYGLQGSPWVTPDGLTGRVSHRQGIPCTASRLCLPDAATRHSSRPGLKPQGHRNLSSHRRVVLALRAWAEAPQPWEPRSQVLGKPAPPPGTWASQPQGCGATVDAALSVALFHCRPREPQGSCSQGDFWGPWPAAFPGATCSPFAGAAAVLCGEQAPSTGSLQQRLGEGVEPHLTPCWRPLIQAGCSSPLTLGTLASHTGTGMSCPGSVRIVPSGHNFLSQNTGVGVMRLNPKLVTAGEEQQYLMATCDS